MKMMKKAVAFLLTAVLFVTLFASTAVFAADEPAQQFAISEENVTLHGKYSEEEGGYSFTYGSAGISANFTGTEFWIYVPSTPEWDGVRNVGIAVLIDSDMAMDAYMYNIDRAGWHKVASGLENGDHHIEVRKQSRGFFGFMASDWFVVSKIGINAGGEIKTPDPLSDLVIEVYGDSITNGDAVWLDTEGVLGEVGQNHAYTFGNYTGALERLLDAEVKVCGNTGNGLKGWVMATPGNGEVENLLPPQNSWSVIDPNHGNEPYSHEGKNAADVVIVNLGTNDRIELGGGDLTDTAFEDEYIRFIKEVKTDCPDAIFICTVGAMGLLKGDNYEVDFDRITTTANEWAGEEFCYYVELQWADTIINGPGYDGGHPSNTAHEVYGLQLATLINKRLSLGIELPDDIPEAAYSGEVGSDISAFGTPIDSGVAMYSGMSKEAAFDKDESTGWQAANVSDMGENCWLGMTFDTAREISGVNIAWESGTRPNKNSENGYRVEYTVNGTDWLEVEGAGYLYGDDENGIANDKVTFEPVNATGVRVVVLGPEGEVKYAPKIYEMQVMGAGEGEKRIDVVTGRTDNLSRIEVLVTNTAPAALSVEKAYANEDDSAVFIATNIYDYSVPAGKIVKAEYKIEREGCQPMTGVAYVTKAYNAILLGEHQIDITELTGQTNGYVTGILFTGTLPGDVIDVTFSLT